MSPGGPLRRSILLVALLTGLAPSHSFAGAATAPAAPRGQVFLPSGRVLQVEVADTPERQALGYMFRERIAGDEGMVFLMGQLDFHSFWMKNCRVSLDIIWMDENWRVVHVERKVPPCRKDPCPSYQPLQASLYVLETQAGLARREGIRLGDHIIYTPPSPAH